MQHKQNAILVRLSFRHPIPVAPFGENLSAPFKLGKDFIMTGVIIQTFGPVKPNLDLARGNDLCHCGRAPRPSPSAATGRSGGTARASRKARAGGHERSASRGRARPG